MDVKIREMNIDDKSEVLEMMHIFYASPAVNTDGSQEIFQNDFDNCISNSPYLEGYIFEFKNIICGYAMAAKSFSTEFGKPCIWIEDIYLKENFRSLGIGKKFFDFIESKYPNFVFRLEAEKDNTVAIRLYKKQGYETLPYLEMKK